MKIIFGFFAGLPFRANPLDATDILGVNIYRADKVAAPRSDGFSFSFVLGGNVALIRLKALVEFIKAAGVEVVLYDEDDNIINL